MKRRIPFIVLVLAQSLLAQTNVAPPPASTATPAPLTFTVTYPPTVDDSFTGRVYLMTSTSGMEPRFGPQWFGTEPFFAVDVVDWKPDEPLVFDDKAISYPAPLSRLEEAEYSIQAVMRRNLESPTIGTGVGTAHSAVQKKRIGGQSGNVDVRIDLLVKPTPFPETQRIKLAELRSDLLSRFHGRDTMMRAAIILPEGYDDDDQKGRRYPALYWIGGFGNDHSSARFLHRGWSQLGFDDQIVRVVLDATCYGGHHVFADSENNGPRGTALVQEFIPHLERTYRLVAAPAGRFLSGHSSGGWSSLWLQIAHPEFFGGTWSIAPDPVDFRDFQRINLYQPGANMFVNEQGERRPIGRQGGNVLAWHEDFTKMEVVQGEGGQLRSFEWVFSRRGDDGLPAPLYDRHTGAVHNAVALTWRRYDIRLILQDNWSTLGPKLDHGAKLNVFMGDLDTFYLEGATKLLKQSQAALGSKAVIEIEPEKDHITIATGPLRQRIDRELMATFVKHHPEFAPANFMKKAP